MQKIALIGNPNCGKTTLFNVLTGARQKVGNWPGVTVEKKFGYFDLESAPIELVDLPGIYSLEQDFQGIDEKIAQDYLQQSDLDVIINIVDATNLERSLVLTQQLMEKDVPMVVVLNMLDVAKQQGLSVAHQTLADQLQVPVVAMVASSKQVVEEFLTKLQAIVFNPDLPDALPIGMYTPESRLRGDGVYLVVWVNVRVKFVTVERQKKIPDFPEHFYPPIFARE